MKKNKLIHVVDKKKSIILMLLSLVLLIFIDQLTKMIAVAFLKGETAIELIPKVFELSYLENEGIAFGLLQGGRVFFVILTVLILIIFGFLYLRIPYTSKYNSLRGAYAFFLAGAVGNFIDRIINGYVIDFFYFKFIDFPIFNMADIYVTCSCIFFFILVIFVYKDEDFETMFPSRKKKQA